MKKKFFYETVNLNYLSDKSRRFFEESDQLAIHDLFCRCNSYEDIEAICNDIYNEIFCDEVDL